MLSTLVVKVSPEVLGARLAKLLASYEVVDHERKEREAAKR